MIEFFKIYYFLITEMSKVDQSSEFKKYSKVSSGLKCMLFKCIYIKKMSIKDVIFQ